MPHSWTFQAEPGLFDDLTKLESKSPTGKITTQPRLSLLTRSYPSDDAQSSSDTTDWARFATYVRALNRDAAGGVSYKVLYLTRHGIGYHNRKHVEVGTEAWDKKWSLLNGDENSTWFDSLLTEKGIQQAKDVATFFQNAVKFDLLPLPQVLYTSPLARCLQTTDYAFHPLMTANNQPFRPIVKENLRERNTMHTCDFRRPRSWIEANYPGYVIEDGLAEEDSFPALGRMETDEEHVARKHAALVDIFETEGNGFDFLSLTVHSYAISAILVACGLASVHISEASSIALLVRGQRQVAEWR